MFYANLRVYENVEDLKTLMLGNHIIMNEFLVKDVIGSEFQVNFSYMNNTWPEDFDVSLEVAKMVVVEPDSDLLEFGPIMPQEDTLGMVGT